MTFAPNQQAENAYLSPSFPADVWHGATRFESAEQALLTLLAVEAADKPTIMLDVLRDKFARHPELGERLIQTPVSDLADAALAPSHALWTADDIHNALTRVRRELAGQEVMRTGMLLATHGSLVLMARESDLGPDLVEGAQRAGFDTDAPTDSPSLSAFEDAMADAIARKWDDTIVELFEMGKTILLFLSMDGLADEEPEYRDARDETRRVLQESADRVGIGDRLWTILDEHGGDPERITDILRTVSQVACEA